MLALVLLLSRAAAQMEVPMLKQLNVNLFFLLFAFILSASLTGCHKEGEEGHLGFNDDLSYPGSAAFGKLNTRVAVGSDLTLKPLITLSGAWSNNGASSKNATYTAEVDDSTIFSLVSDGAKVTLRALKAGTTKVRFESSNGVDDTIELTAVDIATSELLLRSKHTALTGWGHAEDLTDKGYSLLPEAEFEIGLRNLDADGQPLSGQLPLDWSVFNGDTSESGTGNATLVKAHSDDVEITAKYGDFEENLTLSVINDTGDLTLAIYRIVTKDKGYGLVIENDIWELYAGSNGRLVYLMDAEGRIVIPAEQKQGLVSVVEGSDCLAEPSSLHAEILKELNAVAFSSCEGTGTLRFSYQDVTRDITVTVTPKPETKSDDRFNACEDIGLNCPEVSSEEPVPSSDSGEDN
jgi:hypothetical protein